MNDINTSITSDCKVFYLWHSKIGDYDFPTRNGTDGVVTVVSREEHPGIFHYGVSVCMPGDNFEKHVGRQLSYERLLSVNSDNKHPLSGSIKFLSKKRYLDIKLMLCMDMYYNMQSQLPDWVIETLLAEIDDLYYQII